MGDQLCPDNAATVADRVAALDWAQLAQALDETGFVTTVPLLDAASCAALSAMFDAPAGFRSTVVMQRHGFGQGAYRYFAAPLPEPVASLRAGFYPHLVPVANRWATRLREPQRFPPSHEELRAQCSAAGQTKPTPLLLRYASGDYNCLHQDLYGPLHFPLQVAILLDRPGEDFDGGEFVLLENRPRRQSRAHVVPLVQGQAVIFAVNRRPQAGRRGDHAVSLRHGVSMIRRGRRHVLGIIFHDAA